MVHAALMQAPVHGGSLKSHQPKAVLGMPGVRAVVVLDPAKTKGTPVPNKGTWGAGDNQVQSGVAVITAPNWPAKTALEALPVEWDICAGEPWPTADPTHADTEAFLGQNRRSSHIRGAW